MFIIHIGYLIDLFLFCQWLHTVPSLGVPPYQPSNFPVAAAPAHARGVKAVSSLGQATDPQQGSPVVAAVGRTCALGQG